MKTRTWLLIVLLIAVLALVKIFFLSPKEHNAGPAAGSKNAAAPVTVSVVRNQRVEAKLVVSGSVMANEEALLKPETAGKIISLEVTEGSEVEKGQLLAKLNDAALQAQLKKAQVNQSLAREKADRLKQLLEIKGVSQEEYDVAQTSLNAAAADVDLIKAQILETEIRAPFHGVVGLRNISSGNYISTQDIIATVQQIDPVKIDFAVPEKYAGQIRKGDTVEVKVEGSPKTHYAKIYALDAKIDPATRALKVRALCENAKRSLYPGAYAQVSLILRTEHSAVVPSQAVIPELRGQKVFVVKGGIAQPVKIETGTRTDSTIEVISGLSEGDSLITGGIMGVKPKAPVKILGGKK